MENSSQSLMCNETILILGRSNVVIVMYILSVKQFALEDWPNACGDLCKGAYIYRIPTEGDPIWGT